MYPKLHHHHKLIVWQCSEMAPRKVSCGTWLLHFRFLPRHFHITTYRRPVGSAINLVQMKFGPNEALSREPPCEKTPSKFQTRFAGINSGTVEFEMYTYRTSLTFDDGNPAVFRDGKSGNCKTRFRKRPVGLRVRGGITSSSRRTVVTSNGVLCLMSHRLPSSARCSKDHVRCRLCDSSSKQQSSSVDHLFHRTNRFIFSRLRR